MEFLIGFVGVAVLACLSFVLGVVARDYWISSNTEDAVFSRLDFQINRLIEQRELAREECSKARDREYQAAEKFRKILEVINDRPDNGDNSNGGGDSSGCDSDVGDNAFGH